jgi:hypothetical protein
MRGTHVNLLSWVNRAPERKNFMPDYYLSFLILFRYIIVNYCVTIYMIDSAEIPRIWGGISSPYGDMRKNPPHSFF